MQSTAHAERSTSRAHHMLSTVQQGKLEIYNTERDHVKRSGKSWSLCEKLNPSIL